MKKDIAYSQEGGQELPTMNLMHARVRTHTHSKEKKKKQPNLIFSMLHFFLFLSAQM